MGKYEEVAYSRSRIEKAGKVIAKCEQGTDEYKIYIPVVDNWRASHAYPLNEITTIISNSIGERDNIQIVQRLKRLESIIGKLKRETNTGLFRMQDLGGCRVIVPSVSEVYNSVNKIKKAIEKEGHEIKGEKDYLENPREKSGYRSYHLVIKYAKDDLYKGMFIEVQVRTKLEHSWATAIEIMDSSMHETLKAETGNPVYMYYFKMVSALFSLNESTKIVKGVPTDKEEIIKEIYRIDKEEGIREKLTAYKTAISISSEYSENAKYYLLITDTRARTITVVPFMNIDDATEQYQNYEMIIGQKSRVKDVVLVAAQDYSTIRNSYPNYFLEILFFLSKINEFCSEYPEEASLPFSTAIGSCKIKELFIAEYYVANRKDKIYLGENGIGIPKGDVIFCPDWPISLDNSYLRYSGIIYEYQDRAEEQSTGLYNIEEPGVIILKTGGCFYVDRRNWKLLTSTDCIILHCKKGDNAKLLLFLIAWLKSNVCSWDLLWNRHNNAVYHKNVFADFDMPIPKDPLFCNICDIAERIMLREYDFVKEINNMNNINEQTRLIDIFNVEILELLKKIEDCFCEFYNIDFETRSIMQKELKFKGYYAYE